MIIFYCHKCNTRVECETKAEMKCECGHYVKKQDNAKDHINMRKTWSGTTKIEFSNTTMEEDISRRNSNG
tara:strand:+ start:385 stop:594 length:210 start_codon:yes stop_codon:yes gene_type:complete